MSKKSFAVGTGAMDLRPLLADIVGGFRFRFRETTHSSTGRQTMQNDVLCRTN